MFPLFFGHWVRVASPPPFGRRGGFAAAFFLFVCRAWRRLGGRAQKKPRRVPGLFGVSRGRALLGGHDADHLDDLVGVTPLVVVPGDELDEGRIQLDAGLGVEGGGAGLAAEVGGDDRLVGVAEDALELAFGGLLHGGADVLVGGGLLKLAGQVDHGDVGAGHAHGHAGELAVELGEDLADGLGGAGGGGDDVLEDTAAAAPVLLGGAVDGLLGGGGGVDGGHQAALDAEGLVDDLGEGRQAVGGAGGVGDDGLAGVGLVVHAVDEHGGVVLGGGGHDDLLGTGVDVQLGLLLLEEEAGGLDDDLGADLAPLELGGILLGGEADGLAVDVHRVALDLDVVVELAVDGIVLQHVGEVLGVEQVVDADDLDVVEVLDGGAEDHAPDAAEPVDANFDGHVVTPCRFGGPTRAGKPPLNGIKDTSPGPEKSSENACGVMCHSKLHRSESRYASYASNAIAPKEATWATLLGKTTWTK